MQAAILKAPRDFIIEERAVPEIDPDEILIQTQVCGICTSELDMWEGKAAGLQFPLFIGHEVVGVVKKIGAKVSEFKEGDHVAVWTFGKGYAEHVAVKEEYAVKLSKATSFDQALGEPIACAVNGVRKANVQLNDSVCLVGCGFMGLIMLQIFKTAGAGMIIAVDTRESILALAKKLGTTHALHPKQVDVKQAVKDLTGGKGVDIGVEAAGIQETLDLTADLVRMEGKLEVFGFHQGGPRKVNWGYWNWMAFQIINGHVRSPRLYVEGMRIGLGLLEAKKLNMELLITHRFPLQEVNHGFEIAASKPENFVKGVITF
ncbi:zinc-binding dehydrogenase [candidate division KSB1 bacterium]|nr:zinc-binding dehydrogenase [candidate division KSB1 bacterium]